MATTDQGQPFAPLADPAALDAAVARSHETPVLLFLHDPYCPISRRAWGELQRLPAALPAERLIVDVSRQHALSDAVAARTGVRHESPQALLLRGGRSVWDASHFAITASDVAARVADNG